MAIFEKNKQRYFASLRLCALQKNYNSYFNSATPIFNPITSMGFSGQMPFAPTSKSLPLG
jgi:hypothetical protein